jgi:hypothetical protein
MCTGKWFILGYLTMLLQVNMLRPVPYQCKHISRQLLKRYEDNVNLRTASIPAEVRTGRFQKLSFVLPLQHLCLGLQVKENNIFIHLSYPVIRSIRKLKIRFQDRNGSKYLASCSGHFIPGSEIPLFVEWKDVWVAEWSGFNKETSTLSLQQAVEDHRVVIRPGSHNF